MREVFKVLAPLSDVISEWIWAKACFLDKEHTNVFTSVILADLLYQSEFLKHPLAQPLYKTKNSNNLSLIEADEYWEGKCNEYNSRKYKSYRDNLHFASDYSDIFSKRFDEVLAAKSVGQQVDLLSLRKPNTMIYNREVKNLIINYRLGDFDG